jgi:hypothetical protein
MDPAPACPVPMPLSDSYPRCRAPETGRPCVQLTRGEGFTYKAVPWPPFSRAIPLVPAALGGGSSRMLADRTLEGRNGGGRKSDK